MNKYKIFETEEFQKRIKKISKRDKSFIEKKLTQHIYSQLKEEPHYGNNMKKLDNFDSETWRYRIGNYRLFYVIDENEKVVYVFSVDLRKNSY